MKPSGDSGIVVAKDMNVSNAAIYSLALSMIDFKTTNHLLEIGFGNGKFLSNYFEYNPNITVYGVDFSETMFREAMLLNQQYIENNQLILKCEDSQNTSFKNDSFDTIITINTIYFWDSVDAQINEFCRLLKKGGTLLVGYRPRSKMETLPFVKEFFRLIESQEIIERFKEHDLKVIDKKEENITRKSVDGKEINSIDICITFENCKK